MAKTKQLLSPHGYISWTQVDMWERSPKTYIKNYMLGDRVSLNNAYVVTGKSFADTMENGEVTGDEIIDLVASLMPRYDTPEKELVATVTTSKGTFVILGKLDSFCSLTVAIREYKTGTTKWTQSRADKHGQLLHYAALVWLVYKKIPPSVHLDWAETELINGKAVFTGRIETFEVKIGMREILEYLNRVSKVAIEIDAAYRAQLAETL